MMHEKEVKRKLRIMLDLADEIYEFLKEDLEEYEWTEKEYWDNKEEIADYHNIKSYFEEIRKSIG